ncbi:hypothetical protein KP806_22085 [Paenibacillus sp. N4]|uniref:hypothetical protein n=1 Tax=Paenibacillus vietnamensis TaxID=2590547 RepID=UPI001CD110D9|nr:hypothetical protein [Paenibacillus vietnamensis]MCA0757756.1 hypothetical protein [Paenibacillus vietnamensis]
MRIVISFVIFLLLLTACQTQSKPENKNDEWEVSSLFHSGTFTHFWDESSTLKGQSLKIIGTSQDMVTK